MILTVDNSKYLFEKDFKRYVATRDYHNAFLFCLVNLQSDTYRTIAKNSAHTLIDKYSYLLFEKYKRVYRFVIINPLIDKSIYEPILIKFLIDDKSINSLILFKQQIRIFINERMSTVFCYRTICIRL